jgi:uncharacterized protein YjiS (DUF1127 family)
MIAGTRWRESVGKPVDQAPATKMAGRITAVVINPERGIFRKHARVRFSPASTTWEISMTYAKHDRRPTALIRPARRLVPQPGRDPRASHGGLPMLSPARDATPLRPAPAAWSSLATRAATLCCCAGNALPSLLLAMLSWAITEVLAGCAAYAEAMYPIPVPAAAEASGQAPPPLRAKPALNLVSAQMHGGATRGRPVRYSAHAIAALAAEWQDELPALEMPAEARPPHTASGRTSSRISSKASGKIWRISLKAVLIACWSRWRRAHDRRRAAEELRGMDDHTLHDIGITRSDIEFIIWNGLRRE